MHGTFTNSLEKLSVIWSNYLSPDLHVSHIAFLPLGSNQIALFVILWSCMK